MPAVRTDFQSVRAPHIVRKSRLDEFPDSTGATWQAMRKDEPLLIMQRCGHADFATTQIYVREAENLSHGVGQVFPPLPARLLGLSDSVPTDNVRITSLTKKLSRSGVNKGVSSGANGDRTRDLLHAMQALSQLSYSPERRATLIQKDWSDRNLYAHSGDFRFKRIIIFWSPKRESPSN